MGNILPVRFTIAKAPQVFKNDTMGFELVAYPYSEELWFDADRVCKDLGYKYTMQTLKTVFRDHINDYIKTFPDMKYHRSTSYVPYVSRIGLQYLVLASHKDSAWLFKKWVVETVLESIYKNGGYVMGQEKLPEDERKKLIAEIKSLRKDLSIRTEAFQKLSDRVTKLANDIEMSSIDEKIFN